MKYSLNVWKTYHRPARYYFTHPWIWIKDMYYNCKAARERARQGYATRDIWNLDKWLLTILPPMLRELANDPDGAYPGTEPFETPEKWELWLYNMAKQIESLQEDWAETKNEYEEKYIALWAEQHPYHNQAHSDEELDDLREKWLARVQELDEQQQELTIKVFEEIGRHLYQLWS